MVILALASFAYSMGGEPTKFMEVGVQFAPFAVLALLAYAGIKNSTATVFTYIWLAIVGFAVIAFDIASVLEAFILDPTADPYLRCSEPGLARHCYGPCCF